MPHWEPRWGPHIHDSRGPFLGTLLVGCSHVHGAWAVSPHSPNKAFTSSGHESPQALARPLGALCQQLRGLPGHPLGWQQAGPSPMPPADPCVVSPAAVSISVLRHTDTHFRVCLIKTLVENVTATRGSCPDEQRRCHAHEGRATALQFSDADTHPTLCLCNSHLPPSDMITLDNPVIFSKPRAPNPY